MKSIHLLLVSAVLLTVGIFAFCRSTNGDIPEQSDSRSSKISSTIPISKWDNTLSRKTDDEEIGWFQTSDGIWIDTMRDEKHKFNAYPPHFDGKSYYPNFTVAFPDNTVSSINPNDYFKVHVKNLDQTFIKNVNPFKDSKNKSLQSINYIKPIEISERYIYASLEDFEVTDHSNHDHGHHDNSHVEEQHENRSFDQIAIDIKQYGDVLISQISTWKARQIVRLEEISTETIIYDLDGKILYQNSRQGPIASVQVSKNNRFVVESWGGPFSEDTNLPYQCSIFDLKTQKEFWNASSHKNCISAGIVDGSNFAMISNVKNCDFRNSENELIAMDMESVAFYEYTSKSKANATKVRISESLDLYFNTRDGQVKLDLEEDFKLLDSLP